MNMVIFSILSALATCSMSTKTQEWVRHLSHDDINNIRQTYENSSKVKIRTSIFWQAHDHSYYLLTVKGEGDSCRFIFFDSTTKSLVDDGSLEFENCKFTNTDIIKQDTTILLRVWMNLPSNIDDGVKVKHYRDFLFNPELGLFCDSELNIPCNNKDS